LCLDHAIVTIFDDVTGLRDSENRSLLDFAVESKSVALIKYLSHFDFVPSCEAKESILDKAVETGDIQVVRLILDYVSTCDTDGFADVLSPAFDTACAQGHLDIVRLLYRAEIDLYSPFLAACKNGHADIVRELIAYGAGYHREPNSTFIADILDSDDDTRIDLQSVFDVLIADGAVASFRSLIHWYHLGDSAPISFINHVLSLGLHDKEKLLSALKGACMIRRCDVVSHLLSFAAEPEQNYDIDIRDMIQRAFDARAFDVVSVLLARYRDGTIKLQNIETDKLLFYAVVTSDVDMVKTLVNSSSCDVNTEASSWMGKYTLLSCSYDPNVVRILLDAKAEVNPEGCTSVLKTACDMLNVASVQMLLEAGANVNGSGRWMPLQYAIQAKSTDTDINTADHTRDKVAVINLLLAAGAATRHLCEGRSALHECVCIYGDEDVAILMKTLVDHDPELLECGDKDGRTPLMLSVYLQRHRIRELIDIGVDINSRDARGNTALHHLVIGRNSTYDQSHRRDREIVQLLLHSKIDPTVVNNNGYTALMLLVSNGVSNGNTLDRPRSALIADILDAVIANTGTDVSSNNV
jgi:ankyrin repeat protein